MKMNDALFDKIIDTVQDCVFWKDKERRFIGVNQAFLDFYGFESADVLIGKTDEDMGWHNDPEPYKQDELRVLAGESTYKVQGKCMIRGQERDIIASKSPIYENGEVVGLVGSFIDVTDAWRRKKGDDDSQIMYDIEDLRPYAFFDRMLDDTGIEDMLDQLTGVISRAYMVNFAKSLIDAGTPFTFAMLDLDNFKHINDTYGHQAGDVVLMDVTRSLADYTRGYGIVGRFGGDEILVINLKDIEYDDKKDFFEKMYAGNSIFHKDVAFEGGSAFLTATIGCATYPADAEAYDELFGLIDKTLYSGKSRGRNCYTIYTEEEHKDLVVKKIKRHGIFTTMSGITRKLSDVPGIMGKLRAVMPIISEEMQIHDLYYVDRDGVMYSVHEPDVREEVPDIFELSSEDLYRDNVMDEINISCPILYKALKKFGVDSAILVRIGVDEQTDGFLICSSDRKQRIWQEDECAIMYYLSKAMAVVMQIDEK